MFIKDQNFFFGSLPCGSMSRVSKIGNTTFEEPSCFLYQILNKPYFKPPTKPLDSQKNPYFKPYITSFHILKKMLFQPKNLILG